MTSIFPTASDEPSAKSAPFVVGEWQVDPELGRMVSGTKEVRLEPRVMDLLCCLVSSPGEVLSRQEIEARVWVGVNVGYDSLASAIIKLRKALDDNSRNPHYIETIPKRGYRLIAPVRSVTGAAAGAVSEPPPAPAAPSTPPSGTSTPPSSGTSTPPSLATEGDSSEVVLARGSFPADPAPVTDRIAAAEDLAGPEGTSAAEPIASTAESLRASAADASTVVPAGETPVSPGKPTHGAERPSRAPRWLIAGSFSVIVVALLAVLSRSSTPPHTAGTPATPGSASGAPGDSATAAGRAKPISLVVLPFAGAERDTVREYFADGITDDLINDLSLYTGLQVVARRSAYTYKGRNADIETIARELNVQYIIDGDVRRDDDEVRLNVQLIDARTGKNIWARRFERKTDEFFEVQDDIRTSLLRTLSVMLTQEEQARSQRRETKSFAAYDLFLQGQASLVKRASAKDSRQAQELMEQAIQLDPTFARAYAALALIHAEAYRFAWTDDPETTRQAALKTGERAIELNEHSANAWWILGYIHLFLFEEHSKAIQMANRALALAPNDVDAALVLAVTKAFDDDPAGARTIATGIIERSNAYSALVPSVLGLANLRLGKLDESLKAYDRSLAINPTSTQGLIYRVVVLVRKGDRDGAEFQVAELESHHPDFDVAVWARRQPFKDKAFLEELVRDLVRAGVKHAQ